MKGTIPILSIVGRSNSGKTTLIEKLVRRLVGEGYRVATIKHNRGGFDIDHEGKDSWRHKQAGARMTVLASPGRVAVIEDVGRDLSIGELRERYVHDVDIIIVEGFKANPYPKIEVSRSVTGQELLCSVDDNLIGVATDRPVVPGMTRFDIDDIEPLFEHIVDLFLTE
ncbi:MAG: molybdopterin-guanine dinucleotide biosynthesis protein B [Deltaproteobacteria bacterium]|nr:molybdopterin-guanine dinucleotide biosynthesis protein B [Deltaproteobacteria bacterium]